MPFGTELVKLTHSAFTFDNSTSLILTSHGEHVFLRAWTDCKECIQGFTKSHAV